MKLLWKLSIPQVIVVLALGLASYITIFSSFNELRDHYVASTMDHQYTRISEDIDKASRRAKELASVFARLPKVRQAYEIASSGDIDDARSPQAQTARELLRSELAPMLDSYKATAGSRLRLHFHLPNGRSLVRMWRDKQTKRNGHWVDISDDISSFRQTVLDVNRTGQSVSGIELGRGGFAIRGVVPITAADGHQLGSVEVLESFAPILNDVRDESNDLVLYMNADKLSITKSLQDSSKYPVLDGAYVRATAPRNTSSLTHLTRQLLDDGRDGYTLQMQPELALGAAPVRDYNGNQIGVIVSVVDLKNIAAMAARADTTLILMLAGMALCPVIVLLIVLRKFVSAPIRSITQKIEDIAEDRADLSEQLENTQRDEIGELARTFNTLTHKLSTMLDEMRGYVNVLNTVPDPIFVVDNDYNLKMANKATLDLLGITQDQLHQCKCHEQLDTTVCGTPGCPIDMVKRLGGQAEADIIELKHGGTSIYIKPSASALHDGHGAVIGYVEVARVVTDLVQSEQEIQDKLERIAKVNDATHDAAQRLTSTTEGLTHEFSGVQDALATQQGRIQETVSAMDQMNAAVQQVARSATEAAEQTGAARSEADNGAGVVKQAVESILRVSEHARTMRETMHGLGSQAQEIGQVLSVITDIADQTNLLALNAAIEAARAGDAGRGFAVVADEVRKLAEKTMQATNEVEKAIVSIQQGAQSSIDAVDRTNQMVDEASTLATKSGEALETIVSLVNASSNQVENIAAAAEEQSMTSEHINAAVDEVAQMANGVSGRMNDAGDAVTQLARLASELEELSAK